MAGDHDLLEDLRAGDRRALARAITLVESTKPDHREQAADLLQRSAVDARHSIRIGISGAPGVGKSTFIEAFGLEVLGEGHRLAVLTVDPSSARSGGSILGDKTRMSELAREPDAFIRPSPGRDHLGGVARHTREAIVLCEAAGFDVVLVETIGVGQSEVEVADMVDLFLLLVNPGSGDDLQGIKRGIMELADLVVVNKADGDLAPAAGRTKADYADALKMLHPRWRAWTPEALSCSAIERRGIIEIWQAAERFRAAIAASGELDEHRSRQAQAWLWSEVRDELLDRFRADESVRALLPSVEAAVASGELSAREGTRRLLDAQGSPAAEL